MRVAVLDHGMGNLRSVGKALEAAGAAVSVTAETSVVMTCDALCFPGQGIFGRCMTNLAQSGHGDLVRDWIDAGKPYLGICLGMQVLFERSEEGERPGLGILPGEVTRLTGDVTIPHIGWNTVRSARRPSPPRSGSARRPSPPRSGSARRPSPPRAPDDPFYFYFDHSFAAHPADPAVVTGWCDHGETFAARIETGSILGVQFHPEKSGADGIALLKEWIR